MNSQSSLMIQVEKCVDTYLAIAAKHYQRSFSLDNVVFNLRGKAAGQFVVKRLGRKYSRTIRINLVMLERHGEDFIDEVVPHECAHFVVFELWGNPINKLNKSVKPHGSEWKEVMKLFGKEPKVRHDFRIDAEKSNTFRYICGCPDKFHELSIIRHNKVIKRGVRYQCRKCLDVLHLCA